MGNIELSEPQWDDISPLTVKNFSTDRIMATRGEAVFLPLPGAKFFSLFSFPYLMTFTAEVVFEWSKPQDRLSHTLLADGVALIDAWLTV